MSFSKVFYGGGGRRSPVDSGSVADGVIYAITRDGRLLWYRDLDRHGNNGPNAERGWAAGSGNQIRKGWNGFVYVFSGGDGIIYAITPDGRLLWYRDDDRQGNNGPNAERGWAAGSGNQIGKGWNGFTHVFSDSTGVIYAITEDGRLLWYRDDDRQGNNGPNAERGWAPGSGNQIHFGWYRFVHVCASGGNIYAVTADGRLLWYKDDDGQGGNDPGGSTGWAAGSGNQIDIGWDGLTNVFAGGFESPTIGEEERNHHYDRCPTCSQRTDKRGVVLVSRRRPSRSQRSRRLTGWSAGSGNQIGKGW